jgi:2-dehydropantoate 2-reductase
MKDLNVLIYGTGAVGIYFGGRLSKAGFNTVFVDLTEKVNKIKDEGLHIQSVIDNDYDFIPTIVDDVSGLPPQDIILVCVKAFQTYDVAVNLVPVVKPSTVTLSLQNGLDNESILSDILGKNLVMGSVLYFNGQLLNESTLLHQAPANIIFGELDHQRTQREEWLSSILSHADINHRISQTIREEIWKKFIWNNAYNSISAITQTTLKQINDFEEIMPTIRQMMREVQQVAQAEGIDIPDQVLDELAGIDMQYGDVKTSMLKDILSRQLPELEPLVGVVLQKAKLHNISTPVNKTIFNLIQLSLCNAHIEINE